MADNTLTADLIDNILAGNLNAAENALQQTLAIKQNDALDQEKIKLSGQIFNNQPPEDEDELDIDEEEFDKLSDEELENLADEADDEDLLDDEDDEYSEEEDE